VTPLKLRAAHPARREFLRLVGVATYSAASAPTTVMAMAAPTRSTSTDPITLFLCGDVMLGRGIDQILPHPGDPQLHEPAVTLATTYVELAERVNGPIPRPVGFSYVWGDALAALEDAQPDLRIVNLETSITASLEFLPKGINYKMHPANVPCLGAAGIDCCVLANNHVLDWGRAGLLETLETLDKAGIRRAGAGRDATEAQAPAVLEVAGKGRVLVFAYGSLTSGIPPDWAAGRDQPGVSLLEDLTARTVAGIAERVRAVRRPHDVVIASIHWGGNWGYEIPRAQRGFAHRLIDEAGIDLVHGHSSHHPKAIEIYRDKPILYGCGDFVNDYEGIAGYEMFRDDLVLMYLPRLALPSGRLLALRLIPFQIRRLRLHRASPADAAWLGGVLDRESRPFGTRVEVLPDHSLSVGWS
jgi:poly-gamma-glutamate capsule biosynthesis protein CapA/YwtB (metallophosphatase superfamily)